MLIVVVFVLCLTFAGTQPATAALRQPSGGGGGGAGASLTISSPNPPSGPAGTTVIVSSNGWASGATVVVSIGAASGNCSTTTPVNGASGTANSDGTAQISFSWPTLAPGTYPVCGNNASTPTQVIQSTNSFTDLSQTPAGISVPASVVSGSTVTLTGVSWLPGGAAVEVLAGQQGGTGCATHLVDLTSQSNGALTGTFTAPTVTTTTIFTIAAVSPRGTCDSAAAPTLRATATLTVTPAGGSGGGNATPTPTRHLTPTPIHLTPTPTHVGGTNPPPAPPPSGPCPPLPSAFCSSVGGIPWCLICLIPLLLLLLLILLVALFARRRNEEVVVSEEDITSTIDPDSVAPMGALRYIRTVRETTQIVNRKTGAVRRSSVRVFDEFVDDQGNTRRRPQA